VRFCGVVAVGAKRARAEIRVPSMAGRMDEQRWRLTSIVLETACGRRAAARIITRIFGPANIAEKPGVFGGPRITLDQTALM
jgi:hypothetical protein